MLFKIYVGITKSTRSETNGIAENAVLCRVREDTPALLVKLGLPEKWWTEAVERFCYLRNIHDKVADRKSTWKGRFGTPFDGPVIPVGVLIYGNPISTNGNSFGTELFRKNPRIRFEFWRRLDRRLDHRGLSRQ